MNKKVSNVSNEVAWANKFNELCHAVFYKNETGAALLKHLEDKLFRSPVAYPDKEPSWAYFNEGQRELLRSFTQAIHMHMTTSDKDSTVKKIKRGVR